MVKIQSMDSVTVQLDTKQCRLDVKKYVAAMNIIKEKRYFSVIIYVSHIGRRGMDFGWVAA
jgi:hypothetical protein